MSVELPPGCDPHCGFCLRDAETDDERRRREISYGAQWVLTLDEGYQDWEATCTCDPDTCPNARELASRPD